MSIQNFNYFDYPNAMNNMPVETKLSNGAVAETFANKVVEQRRNMVQLQASTATASTITGLASGVIDFRLENNIDRISSMWLRIKYNNTSGVACVTSVADGWINQQQIFSNNGSNLLWQSVSRVEGFCSNAFLSRNEWEGMSAKRLSNENYLGGTHSFANNTSGYIYIPIALLFFKATNLRPYTIDGNLLIRLQFETAASFITSGTMTIEEVNLQLIGFEESDEQKSILVKRATIPKILPYYNYQRHNETITLAASSTYQIRLSGLIGDCSVLFFCIRAVADITNPGNWLSFVRVQDFDILDPSNKSLTGYKRQTRDDHDLMYSHQFDNRLLPDYSYIHVWSFSQTPVQDVTTGASNGFIRMNGFESLSFTTRSDITPGAHQILILALCGESLKIQNANVSSTRH